MQSDNDKIIAAAMDAVEAQIASGATFDSFTENSMSRYDDGSVRINSTVLQGLICAADQRLRDNRYRTPLVKAAALKAMGNRWNSEIITPTWASYQIRSFTFTAVN